MNSKVAKKISLISVLFALAIFAAHLGGLVRIHLPEVDNFIVNAKTTYVSQFINGNSPIELGKLEKADNAYFRLKLRFRVDSAEGYPNLFQTATVNSGLRIEISGSNAAIIVADSSIKEGYRVILLPKIINIGQWYLLEIEALNGRYVRVILDEQNVVDFSNMGISFEVSEFLVGGGYDKTRRFRGQIDNIYIKKGNVPPEIITFLQYLTDALHSVLPWIANVGILLSILLCLFIIKVDSIIGKVFSYFRRLLNEIPISAIAGLTFIQATLMYALPAYRHVTLTYFFLFLIGINIYLTLTPIFLKERFFYLLLIPFNGLLIVSILGGYFIGFSINIKCLVPTLLAITSIGLLLNFIFNKNQFNLLLSELKLDFPVVLCYCSLILTPLILILISAILFSEYATSPYRIGPDMALYAKMAQYLIDGGTWSEANLIASHFAGMSPGEINRYSDATMSWPLMYYFRWGLTAFQVTAATITSSRHVYEIIFISMVIPYLFLCGLVLVWLKSLMGLGVVASFLGAIAFALNPNMINIWYEGFYGNTFALCLFILVLFIFTNIIRIENFRAKNNLHSILLLSLLFAASLLSYGEGVFFVLPPLLAFTFAIDFMISRSINWTPYLLILGSACIGLLIVIPGDFIVNWAILTIKQLTEEGGNGYMQPLWALPHEIFGFSSIYHNATPDVAGKLLSRSTLNLVAGLIFSCLILYSLFLYFRSKKRKENTLYITSILLVAVSAGLVYYKNRDNNYTYMKTYVFFLPILFVVFWSSLNELYEKHVPPAKISKNLFFLFLSIPIAINGVCYVFQYKEEATKIEKYKILLHGELRHINFDNVIVYPTSIHTLRTIYPAILQTPWIVQEYWNADRWKNKPYHKNFINHKVYLLVEKEQGHIYAIQSDKIIFQNQYYLIIDSGKIVKDGVSSTDNSIDFNIYTDAIK